MIERETSNGLIVVERATSSGVTPTMTLEEVQSRYIDELNRAENNVVFLRESIAELEVSLEDVGWSRISGYGEREFSDAGLKKIRRMARLFFIKNPLIKHTVLIQCYYVWGQGVTVSASDDDVNTLVQKFLEDPKNIKVFTGHQARLNLEQDLQTEGEIFAAMFTNQSTGRVIVRRFVPDEIISILTNPNDYNEPWFYKRIWTEDTLTRDSGAQGQKERVSYHPDWRLLYEDQTDDDIPNRNTWPKIGDVDIEWDAPIYHVKVGGYADQKRGTPEVYSALDWAKAVKDNLEDYATIRRAQARFAWKQTVKGGKTAVNAAKTKLNTTVNAGGTGQVEQNPPPGTGSTFIQSEGAGDLVPLKTAGSQPSPDEARNLWLMVSAATGIPETMMSGNADVGSYATAKTLDRPTELQMENRRQLWTDVFLDIIGYVVDMAIAMPNGFLKNKGKKETDEYTGQTVYVLTDENDRDIEIRFPSILRHDIYTLMQAIVLAITLNGQQTAGLIDDRTASGMIMSALGENNFDEMLDKMFPGNEFVFNAGHQGPPGADDSSVGDPEKIPIIPGKPKGNNNPDTGGDPTPKGEPAASALDTQTLSLSRRRLQESVGGIRRRKGTNRSGFIYESRSQNKEVKVDS